MDFRPPPTKNLLLWDGDCGFCRRAARWVEQHDSGQQVQVIPYQEVPSPPMTPELELACTRAIHVIRTDGSMLRAGRAAMFLLELCGYPRLGRVLAWIPFIWAIELGYWIVARNRKLFSKVLFRSS